MVKYSSDNKSSSRNLSVVFGPIFFRNKNQDELKTHKKSVQILVQILIENYYDCFGVEKPQVEPAGPLTSRKQNSSTQVSSPTPEKTSVNPSNKKFINLPKESSSEEEEEEEEEEEVKKKPKKQAMKKKETSSEEETESSEEEVKKKPVKKQAMKKKETSSEESEESTEESESEEEDKKKKPKIEGDANSVSQWQEFIDQWKKKYQKESQERKKDKEKYVLEIEKLKLKQHELMDEIEKLKEDLKESSKDAQYGNKKFLSEAKKDYEFLEQEFKEYKQRMELEMHQLKKQHLTELKDIGGGSVNSDQNTSGETKPVEDKFKTPRKGPSRVCFSCKEGINKGSSFMESSDFFYHDDCFSCRECKKIIEGPFLNQEGSLICKPCSTIIKKESVPVETAPDAGPVCGSCGLEIGSGSKLLAIGKPYHKQCFRCQLCTSEFENKKFFNLNGVPVCKDCKKKNK
jgi:hypothetical protein